MGPVSNMIVTDPLSKAFIDAAVQDGNFGEAQQLQLLRMRLIRDYSGLWLLVNRPSS